MKIDFIKDSESEKYLILSKECGSIFNDPKWLAIYDDRLLRLGIFNNDNRLIGAFNLYQSRSGGLSHLKTPPYTPSIALMLKSDVSNRSNTFTFQKSIMQLIAEYVFEMNGAIKTIALPPAFTDVQPFIWKGFKLIPAYTYKYNLTNSEQELLSYMSPERRNDLKRADKDGIETRETKDYQVVFDLIKKTFSRKELNADESFLNKIFFQFADVTNSFAFVSYRNDTPIATSFCIHDSKTAYYLLGGYDHLQKHQGAGAKALWNAILHAQKINLKNFDFEGSMVQPVEKYFRGFGAELIPYFTINRAWLPVEIILKFFKREQF